MSRIGPLEMHVQVVTDPYRVGIRGETGDQTPIDNPRTELRLSSDELHFKAANDQLQRMRPQNASITS